MSWGTRIATLAAATVVVAGGAAACHLQERAAPGPAQCNDARVRADLKGDQHLGIVTGAFGAPAPGCRNDYALVDLCRYDSPEPCGDSTGLARFAHDHWYWCAFFPTTKCVSEAKRNGVPVRWQAGFFRNC